MTPELSKYTQMPEVLVQMGLLGQWPGHILHLIIGIKDRNVFYLCQLCIAVRLSRN